MKWLLYFVVLVSPTWSAFDPKTGPSSLWVALGMVLSGVVLSRLWMWEVARVATLATIGGAVGLVVSVVVGALQGHWGGVLASAVWTAASLLVIAHVTRRRMAGLDR